MDAEESTRVAPSPLADTLQPADLSAAALRHVARLSLASPAEYARQLYRFYREPLTPSWQQALPNQTALASFLALQGANGDSGFEDGWQWSGAAPGWQIWRQVHDDRPEQPARYKLYLSPRLADLPQVLRAFLELVPEERPVAFKVGNSLSALLRPEKAVLYFRSAILRDTAAASLDRRLLQLRHQGMSLSAHGVPFAAPFAVSGLLFTAEERPQITSPQSWRQWVSGLLGLALGEKLRAGCSVDEAITCALEQLEIAGVDGMAWRWRH